MLQSHWGDALTQQKFWISQEQVKVDLSTETTRLIAAKSYGYPFPLHNSTAYENCQLLLCFSKW